MNLNATILGEAIAFVVFVLFCMKYVWPPLMATIEKRQKDIADGLSSVACAKINLDCAQTEAADLVKQARLQAQTIIDQANKRKAQMVAQAKMEAKEERNKMVAQAQAKIDLECKRARELLRKQIAILVLAGAEKIIERSIDQTSSRDIIDQIVAQL